jgi:hypothetical protein
MSAKVGSNGGPAAEGQKNCPPEGGALLLLGAQPRRLSARSIGFAYFFTVTQGRFAH